MKLFDADSFISDSKPNMAESERITALLLAGFQKNRKYFYEQCSPQHHAIDNCGPRAIVEGQKPKVLMICCPDSRAGVQLFTDRYSRFGFVFGPTTLGALVAPRFGQLTRGFNQLTKKIFGVNPPKFMARLEDKLDAVESRLRFEATGIWAQVEYAVGVLGINEIVLVGHTDCGAKKAIIQRANGQAPLVGFGALRRQLDSAKSIVPAARAQFEKMATTPTHDEFLEAVQKEGVRFSVRNLQAWVKHKFPDREIIIRGWQLDLPRGSVSELAKDGSFTTLTQLPVRQDILAGEKPQCGCQIDTATSPEHEVVPFLRPRGAVRPKAGYFNQAQM